MARAQFGAGRFEAAADWAKKSINLKPDAPDAYLTLAASLGHMEQGAEGRRTLDLLFDELPDFKHRMDWWLGRYGNDRDNEHFLDGLHKSGFPPRGRVF